MSILNQLVMLKKIVEVKISKSVLGCCIILTIFGSKQPGNEQKIHSFQLIVIDLQVFPLEDLSVHAGGSEI